MSFARTLALCAVAATLAIVPATAIADGSGGPTTTTTTTTTTTGSGGAGIGSTTSTTPTTSTPTPSTPSHPTVPGTRARIIRGIAYAPSEAPLPVQEAIWAGDQIRTKPYIYGGGHGSWRSPGYDCSGTVSYVLHAARLLRISEDSGQMESWGRRGSGRWITVYANGGHAFVQIAGIRLDTSDEQDPRPTMPSGTGPRWRPLMRSTGGYVARHPSNL